MTSGGFGPPSVTSRTAAVLDVTLAPVVAAIVTSGLLPGREGPATCPTGTLRLTARQIADRLTRVVALLPPALAVSAWGPHPIAGARPTAYN